MRRRREWTGSVFKPKDKNALWITVKVHGAWRKRPTPFVPGPKDDAGRQTGPAWDKARALLAEVREELLAREAAMGGEEAPVSVRAWAKEWMKKRADRYGDAERHLRLYILPALGDRLLVEVSTRHILEMVESWTPGRDKDGNLPTDAPGGRSVGNRYSTCRAMFGDAAVRGLIQTSPCSLRAPYIPPREDKDSEWRAGARFRKRELELLLTPCPEVEPDSLVSYALLGLGALRHGELAGLRWRHLDLERDPLGSILVASSYRKRATKAGKTREMPVHPTLGAILAEWKLAGWSRLMGRPPTDDDLVLALPLHGRRRGPAKTLGTRSSEMRSKEFSWARLERHLEALQLRHRGLHAFRRSFYSLAEADGADRAILYWGVHGRPADMPGQYGEADWRRLCGEVAKLQVRPGSASRAPYLLPLAGAAGAEAKER